MPLGWIVETVHMSKSNGVQGIDLNCVVSVVWGLVHCGGYS